MRPEDTELCERKMTTKHQQLNTLVGQIQTDAEGIRRTAAAASWFNDHDLKNMHDAASAILHKIERYRELLK